MELNNTVNPSLSEPAQLEVYSTTETAVHNREPPPPYSEGAVTSQPNNRQSLAVLPPLKKNPTFYNCTNCEKRVLTHVEYVNSRKTHLVAGFVCGLTFWCLICCLGIIPYMVNSFKKAQHYCPNCNTFLGAYSML